MVAAAIVLMLAMTWGGSRYPWASWQILALIARIPVWEIGFGEGLDGLAAVLDLVERAVGEVDAR